MPLDRPDPVLVRLERARLGLRVTSLLGAVVCIFMAVYVAFAWAISPCEEQIADLMVQCRWPMAALIFERLAMHIASIVVSMFGAVTLLRAAR